MNKLHLVETYANQLEVYVEEYYYKKEDSPALWNEQVGNEVFTLICADWHIGQWGGTTWCADKDRNEWIFERKVPKSWIKQK